MRLVILTKNGVPVQRDILPEILRRARERGGVNEENVVAAYQEFENELDAYAKQLVKSPEYGEVSPKEE